nr:GntR family transcriptional regulator [Pseudomonas sp.]
MVDAASGVLDGTSESGPDAPLFAQVRNVLRAAILSGELAAGQRLPSESELSLAHGVSRITVRQALADLQASGLVRTVNGRGSFVSEPDLPGDHGPLVGVLESMRKRGYQARGKLLSHRSVAASEAVARALRVQPGTPVGAVRVARYCNDLPFAVGTTYTSLELAARLAAENLVEQDMTTVLNSRLGVRMAATKVTVQAVAATAALARLLKREPGSPILRILTTSLDYERQAVAYGETDCNPDVMDYRVTLRRSTPTSRE